MLAVARREERSNVIKKLYVHDLIIPFYIIIFNNLYTAVNKKDRGSPMTIKEMHRRGFEPLTSRFVAGCSIRLSYRCIREAKL